MTVPVDATAPNEKAPAIDAGWLAAAEEEQNVAAAPRVPRQHGVTVREDVIRPLNEHHERLAGYIKGFLLFRGLHADCVKVRDALEDPDRWKKKWQLLPEIRDSLEMIQANFQMREIWLTQFGDELRGFAEALEEAQTFLASDDGPFTDDSGSDDDHRRRTKVGMMPPINRMIQSANRIEGTCRNSSSDEVDQLGLYVKDIVRRLPEKAAAEAPGVNRADAAALRPVRDDERKPAFAAPRAGVEEQNVATHPRQEGDRG